MKLEDCVVLRNGVKMPRLGLGVLRSEAGREVEVAIRWALEAGYRSIDTAMIYGNEPSVGKAVRESGLNRSEIFITTKVWNTDQGYDSTLTAFETSLNKLEMDYVDLYLVHWPVKGKYKETWRAMETIYRSGRARAIGVSNFLIHHLEDLLQTVEIPPMINQIEFHPHLQQPELREYCERGHIQLEAWRPIMKGTVLEVPELVALGKKYDKSAVQVTLRWILQLGIVVIPKSVKQERILSNADLYDFELTQEDMSLIAGLDRGKRMGPDPDTYC